jgi:hypothetical protein
MKLDKTLVFKTLRNTAIAAVYIFLVSQIMENGDKIFGEVDNMFAPFAFLLLFSLSAAVVGGLVLGQSVILFLDKKNTEGTKATIYSIGWLGIYTVLALIVLVLLR